MAIISENKIISPAKLTAASIFLFIGLLMIASIARKAILPPSRAGKGSRLKIPTFIVMIAARNMTEANP